MTIPSVDLARLEFSLALVEPKPEFLTLLYRAAGGAGATQHRNLYFEEENGAWVIPPIGSFSSTAEIDQFFDQIKPKLLQGELNRWRGVLNMGQFPITSGTFDKFFVLRIRDSVDDIRLALQVKP